MAGLLLALVVLAGYVWSALTTIAPRTQMGDLVALVTGGSDGGTLASRPRSDEPINILFLGYGGPRRGGPYPTYSTLLLPLRPATHKTVIMPIPRGLLGPIPPAPY